MNRFMLSAATAVIATMIAHSASANTLYFQMNPNYSQGKARQAFVFGEANTTGSVKSSSGFNQSFDLGSGGFAVIDLPFADELSSGTIENKGFRIDASTNVSGYFLNREPATTDMAYLLDGSKLGTNYVVATYNSFGGEQMSAQATQDNTTVHFTPKGGEAFDVVLNAGQTYMFTANSELTGSGIVSNKPISVFSGNRCTDIPVNSSACDHIVEQIPSTDLLSTSYLVAQTPRTGDAGNVVRVIATENATEVKFNGAVVATLDAGGFYEGRVAGGVQIDSNKKILVAEYLVGQSEANGQSTDPAMSIVPGKDQWLKSYVFATPSGVAAFPTDFVSIVINTSDIATLTVNGILATPSLFSPLGSTAFSFGSIDVSLTEGPFSITAANPFQLLLSGFDNYDSYFTYGGAAFSPGASPPPPPPPNTTGRLFWDGDGEGNANNTRVDGGNGVWTAASTNFTENTGATNGAYDPQPGNVVFSGAPGLVTVSAAAGEIGVTGMSFTVDGYRLTGDPIHLFGTMGEGEGMGTANAVINVGDGSEAGANFTAQIDSQLIGDAGLTKVGLGKLVLGTANTYTGGTIIEAGTLVGSSDSFGSGDIVDNALLVIDQLRVGTLANNVSGTGQLYKVGAGVLTLSGVNTYSGGTGIYDGTLIGSTTSFGSGDIVDAGILVIDQGDDASFGNGISGSGSLVKNGDGHVTLGAVNTYSGGTIISGGALIGTATSFGSGGIVTAGALVIDQSDNAVFANAVSGIGSFSKLGEGVLTLSGVNTYSGGTTISGGVLIGSSTSFGSGAILDNAALVINQVTAGSMANAINGTGTLDKTGIGTLTLTGGGTLRGATSVDAGRLQVDGNLGLSVVTVRNGATLGGNGTVGGIVVLEGGTVAPGTVIGTLSVAGNYSQASRSTYALEIAGAGTSDKVVATGTAVLSAGSALKVTKVDAVRYTIGNRYTVLTANGGVTGTYAVSGDTYISRFANLVASYDAKNVYLTAAQTSSFSSTSGMTLNQAAAAIGSDSAGNGAMYQALAYLQSDAEARAAFDQISGEIHASARGATFEDSRFVREAINNHLLSPGDARHGIWIEGYGAWGHVNGDGNAAKVDRDIGGFFIGGDVYSSDTIKAGIVGGYSSAKIKVNDRNSSAKTDDYHLAAYLGYESGPFALRSGIAHVWRDIKTDRTVSFNGFGDSLTAAYQMKLFQIFTEAAYKIDVGSNVAFEPFGALAFVSVKTNDFKETGGAAALTSTSGASEDYLVTTLGGRFEVGLPVGGSSNFGMTAMAGWRHVGSGDLYTPIRMQFASGSAFDIIGPPIAKDAAALELKVTAKVSTSADFELGYSGQVGNGLSDHGIRAAFRYRF
jgi:outer membrane autotransporter protein